jgi:hypothetical protein
VSADHHPPHMTEAEIAAYRDAHNLTAENIPRGLTGDARNAALAPQEKPMPDPIAIPAVSVIPIIPPGVAKVCAAVAGLLGLVGSALMASSLPLPVLVAIFAVAAGCAFVGGAALPSFFPGRPIVSAALATKFIAIGTAIATYVIPHLPPTPVWIPGLASLVVVILFGLAGKAAPQMITVKAA